MDVANQLQQLLTQGLAAVFKFVQAIWQWCATQITDVPWSRVGDMPGSKVMLLIACVAIVAYFLSRAIRELFSAGEKAFNAFVTLLSVFVKTLPPILMAGLAAAAGAWVVNHVQL